MPLERIKLLLVSDNTQVTDVVLARISPPQSPLRFEVARAVNVDQVAARLADDFFDVLLLDVDGTADQKQTLDLVRDMTAAPIAVVLVLSADETFALAAIAAGAQDCVFTGPSLEARLLRAIRFAIERRRFAGKLIETHDRETSEAEMRGLGAMIGPLPLPISARSLGTVPLRVREQRRFHGLIEEYGRFIDEVLQGRPGTNTDATIAAFAQSLGALDAGPRDVVDLHKVVITTKLEGLPAPKAKSCVEEGRLLLLKVMGQLVSVYRTLSWGNRNMRLDKSHLPPDHDDPYSGKRTP